MKNWEIPKKMKTPWTREKLLMTKKKIYVPMTLLETTMLSKLIDKKVVKNKHFVNRKPKIEIKLPTRN